MFLPSGDVISVCSWWWYTWFKVQAGIVLCNFFLHDFALMQLENLHTTSQTYVIIFGLTQFVIDDLWLH
jgi:hypothetical protein